MVTQENEKQLLLLRKQIENCILEELSDDEEAIKVAKDIADCLTLWGLASCFVAGWLFR
jgi:hypothetical protein